MPSILAVPGIRVGHATDQDARTGCTVVLGPFRAASDVRGLATGTRELDAVTPDHVVPRIDALLLTGGSAFGLAAADGVVRWHEERGLGYDTRAARVPIVPAAVVYDLAVGRADVRPDARMGYAACEDAADRATGGTLEEGAVGAGTGCTVGKILGLDGAARGGVGSWAERRGPVAMGALAVVNAVGDVRGEDGRIIAGARGPDGRFVDSERLLRETADPRAPGFADRTDEIEPPPPGANTTLIVLATNAPLDRAALRVLARAGSTAMARRITPVHTNFDGDVVFAVSTAAEGAALPPERMLALSALAAHVAEHALERAVGREADRRPRGPKSERKEAEHG
ncbi:MAG: P1 family peptidase [Longimicrobiales bacterium]